MSTVIESTLMIDKYFCRKCKDRNYIVECKCGCSGIRFRINKAGEINQFLPNHHHRGVDGYNRYEKYRECLYYYECFKKEHYNGIKWREKWRHYKDGWICNIHNKRLIQGERRKTRDTDKIWRSKRTKESRRKEGQGRTARTIYYKTKSITLSFILKTGYCSLCPNNIYDWSCKKTHMHHEYYFPIFIWYGAKELCVSCHGIETGKEMKKLIKESNQFVNCLSCNAQINSKSNIVFCDKTCFNEYMLKNI